MRINVPIVGLIIGLILPVIGMFIMYLLWGQHRGIGAFVSVMTGDHIMASKVVLLGVLANLLPFTYFNIKRLDYAMRGVFIATMLYVVFYILIRFVW